MYACCEGWKLQGIGFVFELCTAGIEGLDCPDSRDWRRLQAQEIVFVARVVEGALQGVVHTNMKTAYS